MSALEHLWERIDVALESKVPKKIIDVFDQAMMYGSKEKRDKHEFYYAAGYVAYMHPDGKANSFIRKKSEDAFLFSLFSYPGFLPSVLYLAFIKMDKMKFLSALELLYSCDGNINSFGLQLIDRYFEAKICCLIECGYWSDALRELQWFDRRMKEDAQVGIDLINFMRIAEKMIPVTEKEINVVKKIRFILGNSD